MLKRIPSHAMVSAIAIAVASFCGGAAHAQTDLDQTSEPEAEAATGIDAGETAQAGSDETIVVTGSRIRATGMVTPTPVTAISSDDISAMAPGDVTEALDRLPAFVNSASTSDDASSGVSDTGGTNLNLRGLGTARTLTLLNGRRVVPNSKEGAVNIDIFPSAIVERVDIVTGGASAAYGTDAVAGVVNFVLDTDYSGIKGNVQAGITSRGDAPNYLAGLTYGTPIGDRLHFIVSGEYSNEKGIKGWADRDWWQGWSEMTNPVWAATGTGPRNITARQVVGTNYTCGGFINAPGTSLNRLEFLPDGTYRTFVRSPVSSVGSNTNNAQSLASGPGSGCDPAADDDVTAAQEKGRVFSYLTFEASDNLKFFVEGLFAHDQANLGASAATMVAPWNGTIFRGNAFLPAPIQATMVSQNIASFQFLNELSEYFPDNETILRNRTVSLTVGMDAKLQTSGFLDDWSFAAYYSYGKNRQRTRFLGKMRQDRLYVAMDAVDQGRFSTGVANGNIVCRAAILNPQRYGDCVPINLFGEGSASQAAVDWITSPTEGPDVITFFYDLVQHNVEGTFSGNLFDGWGAGPISAAVGGSYREQSLTSRETGLGAELDTPRNTDLGVRGVPGSVQGDPDVHQFDSFSPINGAFNVKEAFAEINVPIIADAPLMRRVTANGAVRWADYSGSGTIWAYKVGLDWELIPDIRLRGTYSRDVRAATLSERFDVQRTNGQVSPDPVTGQTYNFSQTTGGNPNVAPEKADTLTAGVVLQPSFLPGLGISADYWKVKIAGAIGQLGPQRIADQCFAGAQALCDLITRDPTTNLIVDLQNVFININQETASGVDFEVDYRTRIADGHRLRFRGFGSWLLERELIVPGAPRENLLGQYAQTLAGDFFAYPKLQATANVTYEVGAASVFIQQRYISAGKRRNTYVEGVDVDENDVEAVSYTDLGVTFDIKDERMGNWELYGFVTNLFDRDPPLAPQPFAALGGSTQTNRQLYDVRGTRFQIGARFEF